ncbi:MAG: aminotransferase class I/II-fold pyridoxal phosphate-dependent enzyme [Christensenellales bacterium]
MQDKDRPLLGAIQGYIDASKARFHMPGHSGNLRGGIWDACPYDVTEIGVADNLLNPQGVIAELEADLAKAYEVDRSLIFTTGSTTAILASLGILSQLKGEVVVFGEMHKAFWNGVLLHKLQVREYNNLDELSDYMQKTRYVSAICTTSPNYFGKCKDLAELRRMADEHGAILWVDSAHGAHFAFADCLPDSPSLYAHLCVHSMHKTLPCYGGASVLNVTDSNLVDLATYYRNVFHTSSPSYLTMQSMDWAVGEMTANGERYYQAVVDTIKSLGGEIGEWRIVPTDDPTRLVLQSHGNDASFTVEWLSRRGIEVEMTYLDKMVLIVTPYNYNSLELFVKALSVAPTQKATGVLPKPPQPNRASRTEGRVTFVELSQCEGKVSACEIGVYPPGVPIVRAGEIIDATTAEYITANATCLFGLVNGRVAVLQ